MTPSELQRLSDLNVLESVRDQARWTTAGEIVESDGVVRAVSATRFPIGTMNCAMLTRKRERDLDALIHELRAFYGARDRGYTIKLCGERDAALERECEKQGMFKASENPAWCSKPR